MVQDVLLHRRAVVDDLLLLRRQVPEGHVRPDAHGPAHVGHQGPHQAVPGGHRPLVDGQGVIRHQGGAVHRPHHTGAAAGAAGPLAVEGQLLRSRRVKARAAHRAHQLLPRRHRQGGRHVVPIGAAVAGQAGPHQPQAVEELRPGAEGAADARHAGPLVQRQGRRDVQHLVHVRPGRLGHPAAGIGGQGLQIPPGALGVQHPQGQGGLPRPGDPGHPHDPVQGHVHIHIFQIVYPGAPDLDLIRLTRPPCFFVHPVCPHSNGLLSLSAKSFIRKYIVPHGLNGRKPLCKRAA